MVNDRDFANMIKAYRLKPLKRVTFSTRWMLGEGAVFSDCPLIILCTPCAGVLLFVDASLLFKHKQV